MYILYKIREICLIPKAQSSLEEIYIKNQTE